jgi:hypothetical protein
VYSNETSRSTAPQTLATTTTSSSSSGGKGGRRKLQGKTHQNQAGLAPVVLKYGMEAGGHAAAVNCVRFGQEARVLLSGGNDRQLVVWDWERMAESAEALHQGRRPEEEAGGIVGVAESAVRTSIVHTHKINCMCPCGGAGGFNVVVADTTKTLKLLRM